MPARLQLAQHVEQVIRFRVGQRRRRLVEHENPAIEGERAGDLEELPVRGGERFGERVRIDRSDRRSSTACVRDRIAASSSRPQRQISRPQKMLAATLRLGRHSISW